MLVHNSIPHFDAAFTGIENGYRHCFRKIPARVGMTVAAPSLSGGHGPCTFAKSCSVMKRKDEFDTERTGDSSTWKERIKKAVRKLWGASRDFLTPRHGPIGHGYQRLQRTRRSARQPDGKVEIK